MFPASSIVLRKSKIQGMGVFASRRIPIDELVEICPILKLLKHEYTSKGVLADYIFGENTLLLGYGCLYNHSSLPNAVQKMRDDTCVIRAVCDIQEGEEILIDYGRSWWSSRGMVPVQESISALRSQFGVP